MKKFTLITIGVLSAIVGVVNSKYLFNNTSSNTTRSTLDIVASSLNKKLPRLVDETMRWDTVIVLSDDTLAYYFTLIGIDVSTIDKAKFKDRLTPSLIANFKTNPSVQQLIHLNVNLKIVFKSENGSHFIDIDIPYTSIQ